MRLATLFAAISLALAPCTGQQAAAADRLQEETAASTAGPTSTAGSTSAANRGWKDTDQAPTPTPPQEGQPVPEPSTLLLVGTGLVGLAFSTRLRRRRATDAQA